MLAWTILITENIFLLFFWLIWINRHCQQCHKVKCLERTFNHLCRDCKDKPSKNSRSKKKEETPL